MSEHLERGRAHLGLSTTEPTAAGHGFISGLVSALLGLAGLGLVLGLRFPDLFSQVDVRAVYGSTYLRPFVHVVLVASFLTGSISAVLRANKTLAAVGIGSTLAAALLGGSRAGAGQAQGGALLAVDFFVLN